MTCTLEYQMNAVLIVKNYMIYVGIYKLYLIRSKGREIHDEMDSKLLY